VKVVVAVHMDLQLVVVLAVLAVLVVAVVVAVVGH
jgi:hypothetical protein